MSFVGNLTIAKKKEVEKVNKSGIFPKIDANCVILFTGRQTQQAFDILTSQERPAAVLAAEPPYNIKIRDDRWERLVTTSANAPVFGLPVLIATDAFFRNPIVESTRKKYAISRLELGWSTFVASKHTKIDRLMFETTSDNTWQTNLLLARKLFEEIHLVLRSWDESSDVPTDLQKLEKEMKCIQSADEWITFLRKHLPFLPEDFKNHLHVTPDPDMILSAFGCLDHEVIRESYNHRETKRALEWVSKLLTVTWGIRGCLGDFFNSIFLLAQRAIELHPQWLDPELTELLCSPPLPSRDASNHLARVLRAFEKMVNTHSLVPFLQEDQRLVHIHDFEGDDDKSRLIYLLWGVESQEIIQIPRLDPESGWTEKSIETMELIISDRINAVGYQDNECTNGKVLKNLM